MSDDAERRVFHLEDEHSDWADMDDDAVYPERPTVPGELQPLYTVGEEVDDVDDLHVYYGGHAPTFGSQGGAIEATPEELTRWTTAWAAYQKATATYRRMMEAATTQYEAAHQEGLQVLRAAMEGYRPVEEALKAKSVELAAKLHAHHEAAEKWEQEQEEKKQANLDAIHGPRVIMVYEPKNIGGANRADWYARVHLVTCKRRPQGSPRPLRANDAWEKLTHPQSWDSVAHPELAKKAKIKLCSSCKPWTVLMEHADVTTQMLRRVIDWADLPEGLMK